MTRISRVLALAVGLGLAGGPALAAPPTPGAEKPGEPTPPAPAELDLPGCPDVKLDGLKPGYFIGDPDKPGYEILGKCRDGDVWYELKALAIWDKVSGHAVEVIEVVAHWYSLPFSASSLGKIDSKALCPTGNPFVHGSAGCVGLVWDNKATSPDSPLNKPPLFFAGKVPPDQAYKQDPAPLPFPFPYEKVGPDLTVAKFWVETDQIGGKPHWYFIWRVENIGNKHSGATTLKITCVPQGDSVPCPAGVAKSYDVWSFWPKPADPEEAKAKEYMWAVLKYPQPVEAPAGPVAWKFTAAVDPDNKVAEKNESNNVLVSDFPLKIDPSKFAGQYVAVMPGAKGGGEGMQEGSGQEQRQQLPGPRAALQRQAADEAARGLDALAKRLTPLQQDREAQLLLRDIQALQRELAAGPDPKEAERLRRDAERLTREADRLEASLLREQQRAAAAAPSKPATPEAAAPALGPQPSQPSESPKVAAVPRPAAPARDPVAEQATKELEALAKRLTALGANPEAQRLLREVQLLQRQLGSEPDQAPAILREAQRLDREVDRLEASLRQPAPRGAPSRRP